MSFLSYYLVAGRGGLNGGAVFFSFVSLPVGSFWVGFLVWVLPALLLALVWAAFWGSSNRSVRLVLILLIVSVPPVGLFGWANPVSAAGVYFPGAGWLGLFLLVLFLCLLAQVDTRRLSLIVSGTLVIALGCNLLYKTPETQWRGVDTHLGTERGYDQLQAVLKLSKDAVSQAPPGAVIVLPEMVGGDWDVNEAYWHRVNKAAAKRNVTLLVGAYKKTGGTKSGVVFYQNGLFGVGYESSVRIADRVPVPFSMWYPFAREGAIADWWGRGSAIVHGISVAHLICYEQLLVWPVLVSMLNDPQILIGASNDWWARDTSVPEIQRQMVNAWGRLFWIPVVYAANF